MRNEQYNTDEKLDALLKEALTRCEVPERLSPDAVTAKLRTESRPKTITHRRSKKALIAAGAAAAVLAGTTLSVGAAVGWDYQSLFNQYFSDRTDTPMGFDFTGMGLDVDHRFDCEGYTIHIKSILADQYALMVLYDVILDEETMAAYDEIEYTTSALDYDFHADGEHIGFGGTENVLDQTKPGVYERIIHIALKDDTMDWHDISVMFYSDSLPIYVRSDEESSPEQILLNGSEETLEVSLADISFASTKSAAQPHCLPGFGSNQATTISISPISFFVNFDAITDPDAFDYTDGKMPSNHWVVQAVYSDGTQRTLEYSPHSGFYNRVAEPYILHQYMRWNEPIRTNDIVAILIDDVLIPLS